MNNINRRRYVLSFRSFTYFCIFLFLIIFSFLLYFYKNNLIETSKNIIQSFSENFQYQFTKFDLLSTQTTRSQCRPFLYFLYCELRSQHTFLQCTDDMNCHQAMELDVISASHFLMPCAGPRRSQRDILGTAHASGT